MGDARCRLPARWPGHQGVGQDAYLEAVVQVLGGFENADVLASRPTLLLLEALAVPQQLAWLSGLCGSLV